MERNTLAFMVPDECAKKLGGIDFKRLHEFNKAMFDKQGWRILQHPNSIMPKLYKARYFSNCTFLGAELGANPSYC